jgi:hypothetical protein
MNDLALWLEMDNFVVAHTFYGVRECHNLKYHPNTINSMLDESWSWAHVPSEFMECSIKKREIRNCCIWVYLSSIQHNNSTPHRLWPIWLKWLGSKYVGVSNTNSIIKLYKTINIHATYYYKAFKMDEWEICLYVIILSSQIMDQLVINITPILKGNEIT